MKLLSLFVFVLLGFAAAEEAGIEVTEVVAPADTFSAEERATLDSTQETHEFKAEVSRLMDIIINSLYSNRDIFLREMISNSADALDKTRFLSLTNEEILKAKEELEIRIKVDAEARTLTLTDSGVGMTKKDLQSNLGIVARSGTTEFLEKAAATDDSLGLIGQFGVGFYSVYLVADRVTVISKNYDDDQYIWESSAKNDYTIAKDPRGNTLGRGTQIILHLKDDAEEFLDTKTLEAVVTRYSQFINFPIYLHQIEEIEKEVPVVKDEEAVKEEGEEKEEEEDIEVFEEEDADAKEPEMETIIEEVESWKRVNDAQPLWTKDPKEVSEEEYEEFYKALTKDSEGPLETIHFVAEGEISFRALLFIPKALDKTVYEKYYEKQNNLKLYVRRVLISDEFDDFLPQYMGFVKGVVDSDDLPLNVSRETLAQSKVLQVIAKKLKRKVLESMRKIAERSRGDDDDEDEEADVESEGEGEEKEVPEDEYKSFWENYGKSVKMGIMNDAKSKSKLTKLVRFTTTKSNGELTSFEDYVDRMGEDQKKIWFITHESADKAMAHPALEGFARRDIEVIVFSEPLDEYFMAHIHEVDGIEPANVVKQMSDAPWKVTKQFEADKAEAQSVCDFMKTVLGDSVKEVSHSNKLVDSPAVITATQFGNTANMERVQSAQSLSDSVQGPPEKNLEVNWRHPIIKEIAKRVGDDAEDETAKEMTWMLFQSAQIYSGYMLHETEDFAARINRVVAKGLGVDPDAKAEEEAEEEEEEEEEVEEEQPEEVEAEAEVDPKEFYAEEEETKEESN